MSGLTWLALAVESLLGGVGDCPRGQTIFNTKTFPISGPDLRRSAARAPYFHNGSAQTIEGVVIFSHARFHIGFRSAEKSDLVAFLNALR